MLLFMLVYHVFVSRYLGDYVNVYISESKICGKTSVPMLEPHKRGTRSAPFNKSILSLYKACVSLNPRAFKVCELKIGMNIMALESTVKISY